MPTSCMTASFFYFISLSYNLLTLIYNSFLSQVYCKVSALAGREYAGQEQYLIRRLNSGFHHFFQITYFAHRLVVSFQDDETFANSCI